MMYVHESGTAYWLYLQNDYFANQNLQQGTGFIGIAGENYAQDVQSSDLGKYLKTVVDSIPELKSAMETGECDLSVVILPESASSTLKTAVDTTTQKMLDEGTNENVLKGVLGIIKENYSFDIEYGPAVSQIKNDSTTYDLDAVNSILTKFEAIYGSHEELSAGLAKFKDYLNQEFDFLQKISHPESEEESKADENSKTDLVDTLIQEMEKTQDDQTSGQHQLDKKLYKNYIKSLQSTLVGGLLQQNG